MNDKHITNTGQIIREYNPWFDWYPDQMLPTCPTGDYRLSLRLRDGSAVSEIARSVLWKDNGSRTVLQYRWIDPRVVVRNPYTGEVRHWGDICQDPEGKLIVTPTPGLIVREQACACFDGQCRGQVVDGKLPNGDLCKQAVSHDAMDETLVVNIKLSADVAEALRGKSAVGIGTILHSEIEKALHGDSSAILQRMDVPYIDPREDNADTMLLIEGQFKDFMDGIGASEDHDDMRKALRSLGIGADTVEKMLLALAHSEKNETRIMATAAMHALHKLGFTYDGTRRMWKLNGHGAHEVARERKARIEKRLHNHYFKDVRHLDTIDVYRVLSLFNVIDPCIQHAVKKLLVAGGRGAGKDISRDIKEAIDSLQRWQEMRQEDEGGVQ